jgi:hypothetical protein
MRLNGDRHEFAFQAGKNKLVVDSVLSHEP